MAVVGKHLKGAMLAGITATILVGAPFVGTLLRHVGQPGTPLADTAAGSTALAQDDKPAGAPTNPPAKRVGAPVRKPAAHTEKAAAAPQAPTTAAQPPAAAPQVAANAPVPPSAEAQPVTFQHAVNAKINRCAPLIHDASAFTTGLPRSGAMSSWSKTQPDEHMFESIMGLGYESALGPKAAAVLVATPDPAGCEVALVQVHPTTRTCDEIQANLRSGGMAFADLAGLPVTAVETAPRQLLLPAPSGGCVVVGVAMERRDK